MKEKVGPPRFCSRSLANVASAAQRSSISCSRPGWSGLSGRGLKIGSGIGKPSLGRRVLTEGCLGKVIPFQRKRKEPMATDVTDSTFENEVLQAEEPVLVDFWAEWCGPCHAVAPVLERIADEHNLKLVKVNIDENQDLAMRYGIQSIPN